MFLGHVGDGIGAPGGGQVASMALLIGPSTLDSSRCVSLWERLTLVYVD